MIESSGSGALAADPDLCRVSVLGGSTQLDVGLPAAVPIAAFITDVVALIESRDPDLTEHDDGAPLRTQHWTLARVGRDPIAPGQTLTDAEVFDGELLVLRSVTAQEAPALFDDVIDAVSRLNAEAFPSWSAAAARWTGLMAGLLAVAVAVGLLALAKGTGWAGGSVTGGAGFAAAVAAVIVGRRYASESLTASMLSLYAIVLLGATAALGTPGTLGSPHLLFAAVATAVVAFAVYSLTRRGALLVALAITLGLLVAPAALIRMIWGAQIPHIAAGAVVAGLVVITAAPRVAVAAARLPVPPVPTAGGAIDPADHEPRPTLEDIGAIGATALPSAAGLEQRALAANRYQSGMLAAGTIVVGAGALVAADPFGTARIPGLVLGIVVAVVSILRGRAFADLTQAVVLIAGGAVTLVTLLAATAVHQPDSRLALAGVVVIVGAAAVAFGVIGPQTEANPVIRRLAELFEYLLIVAIVPLVLWLMDVYSTARNL